MLITKHLIDMAKSMTKTEEGEVRTTNVEGIDISLIDVDILRQAYRDLLLTPVWVSYDNILSLPIPINTLCGDILPPDSAIKKIIQKYILNEQLVIKTGANHNVNIYIIVALIGDNIKLIKNDMGRMGYSMRHMGEAIDIQGMKFVQLQFEPYKPKQ